MLLRKFVSFSFFTFISRILGFIRDLLLSYKFGATALSDAFFIAFKLPNLFRAIFAEGAFNITFVPMYSEIKKQSGDKEAKNFSDIIATILIITLILLCVIIEIIMPWFIKIIVPFFKGDYNLLINLTRIMFPYIFFMSLCALLSSILHARKCFYAMAITPIILNLSLVFLGLNILYKYLCTSFEICNYGYSLSISVVIAGFLQLLWLYSISKFYRIAFNFAKIKYTVKIQLFFKRIIPAIFSGSIYHLNVIVDTLFASSIMGAVSYFYYSDRLLQLPLSLIGIALANIILPYISEYIAQKNYINASNIINKAILITCMLSFPAGISIYFLGETILNCIFVFDNGSFTTIDARNTSFVLKIFAFALPSFSLNKIFLSVFFSYGDTKSPAIYSFICFVANFVLNTIFLYLFGYKGLAIASVVVSWLNLFLMVLKLKKINIYHISQQSSSMINKIFIANCIIAILLPFVNYIIRIVQYADPILRFMFLGSGIIFIIFVYFISLFIIDKKIFSIFK